MGRFLKNGIAFVLTFGVIYIGLFTLLTAISPNGIPLIYRCGGALNWKGGITHQKFNDFDKHLKHDLIVLGSSHAYRGYDMAVVKNAGLTCFNLGSNAQTPLNTYFLVKDLLNENNVKTVLIDVYCHALNNNGLEGTADLTQNYPSWNAAIPMALAQKDPRAWNMLTLRGLMAGRDEMYEEQCNGKLGSCLIADSLNEPVSFGQGQYTAPSDEQLRYLTKTIKYLKSIGAKVVLTEHPSPDGADRIGHRNHLSRMKSFADENGIETVFVMDLEGLDPQDHFYDHTHLNAKGAALFTRHLLQELAIINNNQ